MSMFLPFFSFSQSWLFINRFPGFLTNHRYFVKKPSAGAFPHAHVIILSQTDDELQWRGQLHHSFLVPLELVSARPCHQVPQAHCAVGWTAGSCIRWALKQPDSQTAQLPSHYSRLDLLVSWSCHHSSTWPEIHITSSFHRNIYINWSHNHFSITAISQAEINTFM